MGGDNCENMRNKWMVSDIQSLNEHPGPSWL